MANFSPITPGVVTFESVGLRYDKSSEVLKDINFSLRAGSFHFLTGKSGAGKSSLLSMIYLAQRPTRGQVSVFGNNVGLTKRQDLPFIRRRIGVVFQDFRLINHLSAFDNVALPLRVNGTSEAVIKNHVTELLRWVELEDYMKYKPQSLSGGQQQRLAIARAVINRPELLVADEPTGNVDNAIAQKLMRLFVQLNKQGTTVVIATHSERLISEFNYPRLHLVDGKLRIIPASSSNSEENANV